MSDFGNKIIMEQVSTYLSREEEVLSVGGFQKRAGYLKNKTTFGLARFSNKSFNIVITNKRVIVLPLNKWNNKVEDDKVFSANFKDVEIKGNNIYIDISDADKPLKLHFFFGIEKLTGLSKNKFIGALYRVKRKGRKNTKEK